MGLMEGLIGGFSRAASEHQRSQADERARQSDLESRIFSTLAGSTDPEIQAVAVQGMLTSATGKGKKPRGMAEGLFGRGTEPSPALGELMAHLSGRAAKGGPPAAQPDRSFVQGAAGARMPVAAGANTPAADVYGGETTTVAGAPSGAPTTPEPIFKSPAEVSMDLKRREREELLRELQAQGAPPEVLAEAVYGVRRQPPLRPLAVPRGGAAIDPDTGEVLYEDPRMPGRTGSQYRTVAPGGVVWDEATGRPVYSAPRAPTEGTKDRPEYLDALAAQKQIEAALEAQFGKLAIDMAQAGRSGYEAIHEARESLSQQFGYESYADLQRQAGFRRTAPPPLGAPDQGPAPTVMGDRTADDSRMEIIVKKWRAFNAGQGPEPSPQDIEFAKQYMSTYQR